MNDDCKKGYTAKIWALQRSLKGFRVVFKKIGIDSAIN